MNYLIVRTHENGALQYAATLRDPLANEDPNPTVSIQRYTLLP